MLNILKTRRQKTSLFSLFIMVVVGLVFTVAGMYFVDQSKIDPSWTRTTGSVVDIRVRSGSDGSTYSPVVSYTASGQQYTVTSSISTSARPSLGDSREVAYNPDLPEEAKVVGGALINALLYLFPVIGVLFLAFGAISFIRSRKRESSINTLIQTGTKVQGIVVDIQHANSSSLNGGIGLSTAKGPSSKLVVAAPGLDGATHNFVSDGVSGIGLITIANFQQTPIPIDVYINPTNPDDYYVDLADIPELSPDRIMALIQSQSAPPAPIIPSNDPPTSPTT